MIPKVSILVPIYNVESFIERCAVSLFEQTFNDIEYVFVDDCTPDNSMKILQSVMERYPSRVPNIKIVEHKVNRGISAARNTALSKAKGEFFLFVDSDDYIELEMIEKMYSQAVAEDADIVVCDFSLEWKNVSKIFKQNICNSKVLNIQNLLSMITMPSMWNKMIKLSLISDHELHFIEGKNVGEDYLIMPKVFYYANKAIKLDLPLYHYVQINNNSYTKSFSKKNIESIIFTLDELTIFFRKQKDYDSYKQYILRGKLRKKIEIIFNSDEKYWEELFEIFPETNELNNMDFLTKREKIIYYFILKKDKGNLIYYKKSFLLLFNLIQKIKGR